MTLRKMPAGFFKRCEHPHPSAYVRQLLEEVVVVFCVKQPHIVPALIKRAASFSLSSISYCCPHLEKRTNSINFNLLLKMLYMRIACEEKTSLLPFCLVSHKTIETNPIGSIQCDR